MIYRWSGSSWVLRGKVPHLLYHLNADYFGGWFIAVPSRPPSSVAFELVGSCCAGVNLNESHSTGLITNAGEPGTSCPARDD